MWLQSTAVHMHARLVQPCQMLRGSPGCVPIVIEAYLMVDVQFNSMHVVAQQPDRQSQRRMTHQLLLGMQISKRVKATNAPIIGKTKELIAGVQGVQSLAQGVHSALAAHRTDRQFPATLCMPGRTIPSCLA